MKINKKPKNADPVRYSKTFLNTSLLLFLIFLNDNEECDNSFNLTIYIFVEEINLLIDTFNFN